MSQETEQTETRDALEKTGDIPVAAADSPPNEKPVFSLRSKLIILALALLIPPGLIVLRSVEPTENSFYPKCVWNLVTRTHCPGCGTARGLHKLLNGEIVQAIRFNILLVFYIPYFVWYFCRLGIAMVRNKPMSYAKAPNWVFKGLLVAIVAYWILRNIPIEPFTNLAPYKLGGV